MIEFDVVLGVVRSGAGDSPAADGSRGIACLCASPVIRERAARRWAALSTADKLRRARLSVGLTQVGAAIRSGVGDKFISSFETGDRVEEIKLGQLRRLLVAYGMTLAEFFGSGK